MPEENNIILTQKIRNPEAEKENENEWIDVLKVDKNKNIFINAIVTTDNLKENSITYTKMYKGENSDLKPVRSDTIQNNAIQNAAMYKISDESLEEDQNDVRPVSTDTIQKNAIIDSKIKNNEITLRKLGEPLAYEDELPLYEDSYRQHYADDYRNYKITFYSIQTKKEDAWEK